MLPSSRSLRSRVVAAAALVTAPLLVLAACGGGDDTSGFLEEPDASGGGTKDSGPNDATVADSGPDSALDAAPDSAPVDAASDADADVDVFDAAQNFDGGPYLLFFGQTLGDGGSEGTAGFHLYDETTLLPAGDFTVDSQVATVLDVTRDPTGATWWTTARLASGVQAAAGYAERTGVLSTGPTALTLDGGSSVSNFVFASGAAGSTYFGTSGELAEVSSSGAVTPIALPDPTLTVNYLAFDGTTGLLAATSLASFDGGTPEPQVLVLAPGQTTVTSAPASWVTYVADGGTDAGEDAGDASADAGDAAPDAALDAGDAGDGGDAGDSGGGGLTMEGGAPAPPVFTAAITALTVAPAGTIVYGVTTLGLTVVDLTASSGTLVPLPAGLTPSSGAIPVVTADGAHVVFAADTADFARVLLVFDTASFTFTAISDTPGYAFSTDLVVAGDGVRIFGVELANAPDTASQLVRIDPVARTLAQTAPLALDERASLLPRFFAAQ